MITGRNLDLKGYRLFESSDIEETRSRISAVMQPHDLKPIGSMRRHEAYMDYVDLAGLGLGSIKFGPMHVKASQVEDYHLVILCRQGRGVLHTGHEEVVVDQQHGACLPPGAPLNVEFSDDCEQFILRIGRGLFLKHTGQANPELSLTLDLHKPALQSWAHVLWSMTEQPGLALTNRKIALDYQRLLLGLLLESNGRQSRERTAVAPFTVKRAEAFIRDHAAQAICLADIAEAANVPARTLLDGFRRFRQTSPMAYLRDIRLDRVHQRLINADSSVTITTIALEEGFSHLGRFSREYAKRFGEKPSDTFRVSHGTAA